MKGETRTSAVVSVIMAVRNGGAFLAEAISRIREQSIREWECIIVDDGSDDGSDKVLIDVARIDGRFRILRQDRLGLVAGLNRAANAARGEFLARMDADDKSHPERLGRQLRFLSGHPTIGVLGTAVRRFGDTRGIWRRPTEDADLRAAMLFETPFAHPTVMMRRCVWLESADPGYREEFRAAEDIDLWERLAAHTGFANLAEPLLDYRVHPRQVTALAGDTMAENGARVRQRWLNRIGLEPSESQMQVHESIAWLQRGPPNRLIAGGAWLNTIAAANRLSGFLDETALARSLGYRWLEYCNAHSRLGLRAWSIHRQAAMGPGASVDRWRMLRFGLLCACRQLTCEGGQND